MIFSLRLTAQPIPVTAFFRTLFSHGGNEVE